MDFILVYRVQT